MTERDLGSLLERASEHLPEVDFAQGAWSAAVAERARRRRMAVGALGAVAAAGLAVTAVQLGGSPRRTPTPAVSSTTTSATGTLADGTAYAVMPMEGTESQLPDFDAGLPSVIDLGATTTKLSEWSSPPQSIVAVYLRADREVFHPVLVTGDKKQILVDGVSLVRTNDANGNSAAPLGPRAIGGGGRYVVFPQRDHVLRLDTHNGDTVSYPVPSQHVEWADWDASDEVIVARDASHAWTIDPSHPGAKAVAADATYPGLFRIVPPGSISRPVMPSGAPRGLPLPVVTNANHPIPNQMSARLVTSPVAGLFGETINTQRWAASGAFFDQNITSEVIRRGSGPIYQGLVAVDSEGWKAKVLLAPENPDGQTGRFKGCCTVLGWADGKTVLFSSVGSHGRWILAWNVTTGQVFEVSRLVTGALGDPATALALNVGQRS